METCLEGAKELNRYGLVDIQPWECGAWGVVGSSSSRRSKL